MISLPSSFNTNFRMIFLPRFLTRVLLTSVPTREILEVNFIVPSSIEHGGTSTLFNFMALLAL